MKSQDTPYQAFIAGNSEIKAFELTPRQRLQRQLTRLNINETDDPARADIILSGECLYGASVLSALTTAPVNTLLLDDEGAIAGQCQRPGQTPGKTSAGRIGEKPSDNDANAKTGAQLAGRYDQKLRKRTDPTVLRARSAVKLEQALFAASYKGVTDFVTKHIWPPPALIVTRWCAKTGISPNQVTIASGVLVGVTFWLFWIGAFGWGLVAAWAMTFLDTVDGKLARVTLTSSRIGDILDHGIDLLHPPFWWWAWAVGCAATGTALNDGGLALGAIVAGYILQRVEEGIFIARFGIEMHIWRPFDSFFRQITARRNPNLVILTLAALAGYPREGLIIVAIWTILCLIVHAIQILQAFTAARQAPLTSWLAREE